MLSPGLWRRLFRPNLGSLVAAAAGDRRRVRGVADRDDLPAVVRYPDGCDRYRGSYPAPLIEPRAPMRGTFGGAHAAGDPADKERFCPRIAGIAAVGTAG